MNVTIYLSDEEHEFVKTQKRGYIRAMIQGKIAEAGEISMESLATCPNGHPLPSPNRCLVCGWTR